MRSGWRHRARRSGPLTRISPCAESATRVQNNGTPTVVTCEHASVRPYVSASGTPAASARSRSAAGSGAPPTSA